MSPGELQLLHPSFFPTEKKAAAFLDHHAERLTEAEQLAVADILLESTLPDKALGGLKRPAAQSTWWGKVLGVLKSLRPTLNLD